VISKIFSPIILLNFLLILTFSVSINNLVDLSIINLISYIFFHIIFIYILFYHYHYSLFLLGLFYGILFDIFLINSIGAHLISFILLISIYIMIKKYLLLLSSFQITSTIYIILLITLLSVNIFAYIFNNINLTFIQMNKYFLVSIIIFIPSIFILNKLDN